MDANPGKNSIGFDFGTTNSVVSRIRAGIAVSGLDPLNRPIPSAVAYGSAEPVFGHEAIRRAAEPGLRLIRSPKRRLGAGSVFIDGREYGAVEIIADSIRHILAESARSPRQLELGEIDSAVVTIPVNLAGWQRALLREAFAACGLPVRQFLYEPFAALYAFFRARPASAAQLCGKPILVVDWGGGTLDLTLCRLSGSRLTQIAGAGLDDVGGDVIDEMIANHALAHFMKENGLADPPGSPRAALLAECESAKISLSTRERAIIYVPNCFEGLPDNSLEYALTRETLAEICQPVFARATGLVASLLEAAGMSADQVGLCLLVGGMAHMPAIAARLDEMFGKGRVMRPEDCSTLVAEGAAWFASDNAELLLAKDIEVELARGNYLRLLKSGDCLPAGGKDGKARFAKLYCVDPRDGNARIAICQPRSPGRPFPSDPRQTLELLSVQVDEKARPYFEDISLKYNIDRNLILNISAVSSHIGDADEAEIHNLEFAVDLPVPGQLADPGTPETETGQSAGIQGGLCLRSNIVDAARFRDDYYIPGDLLYKMRPDLFDSRNDDLPLIQRDERNYCYMKCALCGRKLHDPRCMCRL